MSADPNVLPASPSPQARSLGEALYFDSGGNQLFGWLHRPTVEARAQFGVVICKAFGYEAICSHRSVRTFAEVAAAAGIPALRFDYAGTGDSSDVDPDADQVALWTSDIEAAIGELQRRTGVSRVCLIGIRLGALLASLAAGRTSAVDSVILAGPIISGRKYLRELRTTQLAAGLSSNAEDSANAADARQRGGPMEVAGFALSAATVAALTLLDLESRDVPARDMLILDGTSMPTARRWSASLAARGIKATYMALPGLVEMVMTAPQFAAVPREMTEAMRDWLVRSPTDHPARDAGDAVTSSPIEPASSAGEAITLPANDPANPAIITERPVFIDANPLLFGIVAEPRRDEIRRRAVVLLNAGVDYHIGASRMYVTLARQWARRGYVVLRLDLGGIGDSATGADCPDDEVFPPEAIANISSAIGFLRKRYGVRDITLAGLCSGAYHALRAAAAPLPINRILMVNPQNFFWKAGMTLDQLQLVEVVHNPGVYRERMFSLAAWKRLLSGRVNIWRIVLIYVQRPLLLMESTCRDIARRLRIHLPRDLGRELEEIAARGIQAVFVFARGEPGIGLLKLQGGSAVGRLGPRCKVRVIEGGDHIFSQSGPRSRMEKVLSEELFARDESQGNS
jgi:alpha-beta hydrolase superfamily lysophospholipase